MSELTALLLKAVRSLSPEEQEQVMAELLDATVQSSPRPAAVAMHLPQSPLPHALPGSGEHVATLRESLAMEAAGPWQAVPVRLPVELHERLRQWCQANGFTMAVVLRGLVARFLDEYAAPGGTSAEQPAAESPGEPPDPPRRRRISRGDR